MGLFERFRDIVLLTRTERAVMLFLAAALIVGAGIRLFHKASGGGEPYDYSRADSEFAARSHVPEPSGAGQESRSGKGRLPSPRGIDINRAGKEELMRLPGIGATIAERIVLYRRKHGAFRTLSGLRGVKGIGKKKLERIIPYCILGK